MTTIDSTHNQRLVADLNWLTTSSALFSLDMLTSTASLAVLDAAQYLPEVVHTAHEPSISANKRLGYYFEQLWRIALQSNPQIERCQSNLQVISHGRTVGEFDSLLNTISGQLVHVELTAKFYLQIGHGSEMADWYGPNLNDRLDIKYQRLTDHQLRLSRLSEANDWLADNRLSIDHIAMLSRGRLFYPYQQFMAKEFQFPSQIDAAHQTGFWLTSSDSNYSDLVRNYRCYYLPKRFWLAEIGATDISQLKPVNERRNSDCQQVVCMHNDTELMRGFVLADNWLERASAHHQLTNKRMGK